jgi:hypothetical protein
LFVETKAITEIENDETSLIVGDVKENIIVFMHTSVIQPMKLMVGRFESKAAHSGIISRTTIGIPFKIDSFENFTFEANEYTYNNNDEISKDRIITILLL